MIYDRLWVAGSVESHRSEERRQFLMRRNFSRWKSSAVATSLWVFFNAASSVLRKVDSTS